MYKLSAACLIVASLFASGVSHASATQTVTVHAYVLPDGVDPQVVQPYLGENKSFADIEAAVRAVEKAKGLGWQVFLPEQEISKGVVRLEARQILVEKVDMPEPMRQYFPSIQEKKPYNPEKVLSELAVVQELAMPRQPVTPTLSTNDAGLVVTMGWASSEPDADEAPAAARVAQELKSFRATQVLDNTGSPDTGRDRLTTLVAGTRLMDTAVAGFAGLVLSVQQPDDVSAVVGGLRFPLFDQNMILDVYAANSKSDTVLMGGDFQLTGTGVTMGAKLTKFIAKEADSVHKLSVNLEQRDFQNGAQQNGVDIELVPDYTVRPLIAGYQYTNQTHLVDVNVQVAQGTTNSDYSDVRANAEPHYTVVRGGVDYTKRLMPAVLDAHLAGSFQWTNDVLVPSEQFGLGGASSVRGFYDRAVSADSGYRASAELLWYPSVLANWTLLAFAEGGAGWLNDVLPGESDHGHIASLGLGARYRNTDGWRFAMDFAYVQSGVESTPKGSNRIHFSLMKEF